MYVFHSKREAVDAAERLVASARAEQATAVRMSPLAYVAMMRVAPLIVEWSQVGHRFEPSYVDGRGKKWPVQFTTEPVAVQHKAISGVTRGMYMGPERRAGEDRRSNAHG
jgi:hypothetical protein